jgi:uncharacterized protein (AIM24 family)
VRVKGVSNMLLGSTGFFVDRFSASHQEGVLWLHGYGNVFEKALAQNEQIDISSRAAGSIATKASAWTSRCLV